MSLEDARARAVPVPDLRLPCSLKDFAKMAIGYLRNLDFFIVLQEPV